MKKKINKITFCALLIGIGIFIGSFSNRGESFQDDTSEPKQIKEENTLSMMIEQTAGAGDYKMETRTSWPTDGYKFNATLSKCENGGELGWDSEKGVVTMTGNTSDKCYVYFDIYTTPTLAEYIINLYNTNGTSGTNIYHHDGTLTNGINDGSYRYAGESYSVKNYVCFGSDADTCPTDNLYRIIGVFGDQVKLIKASRASSTLLGTNGDYSSGTEYYWNYKNNTSINDGYGSNTWSTSLLNKINLNTNYITYLNNINTKWANMIATTTWKVGGNTWSNIGSAVPKTAYANEITSPVITNSTDRATTYSAKIGLMYVSDYGFAASPTAWGVNLGSYDENDSAGTSIKTINWLYLGSTEWTISRDSDDSYTVFTVDSGQVFNYIPAISIAVRPSFYLISSIMYVQGSGSEDDPIRIN